MKKRIISMMLVFIMLASMMPGLVLAADSEAEAVPCLMYRNISWDSENGYYVDETSELFTSLTLSPAYTKNGVFYYGVDGGELTQVSLQELVFSDGLVLTQEDNYISVSAESFGEKSISYTAEDGTTASMTVTVTMPGVCFNSAPEHTEESYIDELRITEKEHVIYLTVQDGLDIDTVTLEGDFANIATAVVSDDKSYATITVTGVPNDTNCMAKVTFVGMPFWSSATIKITDGTPKLSYVNFFSGLEDSYFELAYSYWMALNFYYGNEDSKIEVPFENLVFSGSINGTYVETEKGNYVKVEAISLGDGSVAYVVDGETLAEMHAFVELMSVGFFSSMERSVETYIKSFTVTEDDDTFYILLEDGLNFTSESITGTLADIAEITISEDKTYAVVKVTGTPEDTNYLAEYAAADSKGVPYTGIASIKLINGIVEEKPDIPVYVPPVIWPEEPEEVDVPVSGDENSVEATATIEDSTATVEISEEALNELIGGENETTEVVIDLSGLDEPVDTVVISAENAQALSQAANSEENAMSALTVKLDNGSVTLDSAALETAVGNGNDVSISINNVPVEELNEQQQLFAAERPVVDVTVMNGDATVSDLNGGSITVSVPYAPAEGENTEHLVIWHINDAGKLEAYYCSYENNVITFCIPHLSEYIIGSLPYADAELDMWYYEAVVYAHMAGLMNGVEDEAFAPASNLTRAMLMTILARMDGVDTTGEIWYEKGMEWAVENEISDGSAPEADITREQIVTMLWRYAGSAVSDETLDAYADGGEVSDWAVEAMRWAVENGIISGYEDGMLHAGNTATRSEVAQILMNYLAK